MASRPAKRARISLACTSCREQKTRCDGGKPRCGGCQRKDPESQIACVYHNQSKARESGEIQKLLDQISDLQGKLAVEQQHNNRSATDRLATSDLHVSHVPGALSNNPSIPHISGTERTIAEGAGQVSLSLYRVGDPPTLPEANLSQGQTSSELPRDRSPRSLPHLDHSSNQHASANNDGHAMPSALVRGSSRTETRIMESQTHPEQGASRRSHEPDPRCEAPPGADDAPAQGDNGPYFYSQSSNAVLMQEVNDIISPIANTDQNPNTERSRDDTSIYSAPGSYDRGKESTLRRSTYYPSFRHHINLFELPPRSLADHLLESYFSRVHLLYPSYIDPRLKLPTSSYGSQRTRKGATIVLTNQVALLMQVWEVQLLMSSKPEFSMLVSMRFLLWAVSFQTCQYLKLGMPQKCTWNEQWRFSSTLSIWTIRRFLSCMYCSCCVYIFKLDDHEDEKTKSILETEIRRRTWYSCVMMDLTISTTLGRPAMSCSGFTTPFPRAIDDDNLSNSTSSSSSRSPWPQVGLSLMSFFIETIKLWELTDKIVKALYPDTAARRRINNLGPQIGKESCDAGFDVFMTLETSWTRLYNDLPQELQWSKVEAPSIEFTEISTSAHGSTHTWLDPQRNVLHTRFLYVKLLIYRPLFLRVYREAIPERTQSSETQTSHRTISTTIQSHFATRFAIECFQTAEELVMLVHKLHRTKGTNAWWYSIFYAYFTGIVIILTRFCRPLIEVLGIDRIDKSWALCEDILNHMVIYGDHAKKCLASLRALRSRLAIWEADSAREPPNHNPALGHISGNSSAQLHHQIPTAHGYDRPQVAGRQGRSDVPLAPGDLEFEAVDDWAGALPWDADLDNWWSFETVGEGFGFESTVF